MSRPHAFMRRTWFTCHSCGCNEDGYCDYNRRTIRWDDRFFGCGNYGSSEREDAGIPDIRQMTLRRWERWARPRR